MRLLGLADALRAAGLRVVTVDGWEARGGEFPGRPSIVVCHHTATSAKAPGDYPSLRIVRDGRPDLRGPLSQLGLGRSGTVYVIASGKANHAGRGMWAGVDDSWRTVGIEAESPGDGTWTEAQLKAYPRVCAVLCELLGVPAANVCGHREWALPSGRKPDPTGIELGQLRRDVAALLSATQVRPAPTPPPGGGQAQTSSQMPQRPPQTPPFPAGGPIEYEPGQKVSKSGRVLQWQSRMRERGWAIEVDGLYGPGSVKVAKAFQRKKRLRVDGVVGPMTWAAAWATSVTPDERGARG